MYESAAEALGFDPNELQWHDLVICSNMDTELFYEKYESSTSVAKVVDQMCLSCPVLAQCLQQGVSNKEYGVWGGTYLSGGTADKNRNAHKTEDIWNQIRDRISG